MSINEEKKQDNLSEEDRNILDKFQDPDAPQPITIDHEAEKVIVGGLINHADLPIELITPQQFIATTHAQLVRLMLDYYKEYEMLPSEIVLKDLISRKITDSATALLLKAEMSICSHHYKMGQAAADIKYFHSLILANAQKLALREFMEEVLKPNKPITMLTEQFQKKLDNINASINEDPLMGWQEFCALADQQHDSFLIDPILEAGSLTILHAGPYGGKTVLVDWLISRIVTEQDFFGYKTSNVPVLYFDTDRSKEKRRKKRILTYTGGAGDMSHLIFVKPRLIPSPLTPAYIKRIIKRLGTEQGLVIIDTLRSALLTGNTDIAENTSDMVKILNPLQDLAQQTNWTFLILHHNNRAHDEIAGNAAIQGCTSALWSLKRDQNECVLAIKTRDIELNPISYRFKDNELAHYDKDAENDLEQENFMVQLPIDENYAVTIKQLMGTIFIQEKQWSQDTVERRLKDKRIKIVKGDGSRHHPNKYYR
jgi:hypothetical protein